MQLKPMAIGTLQLYSTGLSLADRALTGVRCVESVHSAVLDALRPVAILQWPSFLKDRTSFPFTNLPSGLFRPQS
jgi:hypothetical protein